MTSEKEKLESLQESRVYQRILTAGSILLEAQAQELDSKIANLQTQLKENESTLAKIASSKEAEEARIAAEKAAKEKQPKKRPNKKLKKRSEGSGKSSE